MQLLRKIGFPISLIYGAVVYLRNIMYDYEVLPSKSFKTPIICVGNLSVGGTGKTPMVEFLIALLKKTYKITVLSRGYGRKSDGLVWAEPSSTVEELGDEPYQIYAKFPDITVVVDHNRGQVISLLEENMDLEMIVLDDGYQHRKVTAGFSILLTAYDDLYSDDWYLPTGNLRDSKREARRAAVIVVTKCPPELTTDEQAEIIAKLKPNEGQKVLFSYLNYNHQLKGYSEDIKLEDLKNKEITLVTGVAKPEPLVSFLTEKGISFEHLRYRDHHFFSLKEIESFRHKTMVLTTEKDFTRLSGRLNNICYITIQHKFLGDGEAQLTAAIFEFMKQTS